MDQAIRTVTTDLPTKPPFPSEGSVSIVIPMWNEEENVSTLLGRLAELSQRNAFPLELVLVDDGSTDRTYTLLQTAVASLPHWTLLRLARNFGQQAAYRAGLDHARGEAIVFLDADLQDPPEAIPELVQRWQQGAKVVVAVRRSRPETGVRGFLLRRFHTIFKSLTGGVMPENSGTFGLMDRIVADQVRRLPEVNLFLPGLRSWFGYRQEVIYYDRAARVGQPKQTFRKLFGYAWDGITSFSELPLKLIGLIGLVISILGFSYAGLLIVIKVIQLFGYFRSLEVMGFTTLSVAVLSMGGIQLLCLGIIGEYVARSYRETKRRPIYVMEELESSAAAKPNES